MEQGKRSGTSCRAEAGRHGQLAKSAACSDAASKQGSSSLPGSSTEWSKQTLYLLLLASLHHGREDTYIADRQASKYSRVTSERHLADTGGSINHPWRLE